MKYFIDTEFIESGFGKPIYLLSIGIVAEDGREFYLELSDTPKEEANEWVRENVLPHLLGGEHSVDRAHMRCAIEDFITGTKPEFWGYYADYDWVVFCQVFGNMTNLPKGWPMYCRDLKQLCVLVGNPELPKQESKEHNALNDAFWNKEIYKFLTSSRFLDGIERWLKEQRGEG